MTTTTYRLEITQGIGYAGRRGERAYVAEITGTDAHYGLARQFRNADEVERDHFGRPRYTRTYIHELGPGLYEVAEHGDRRYLLVWEKTDRSIGRGNLEESRVRAMAKIMDAGETFEAARLATRARKTATAEVAQCQS